ncbi:amino acid/polyamine transporter I [Truncatella angustata]|uniref:Amino acid/polyamine transporter I n=1 Tax=Truncatella angustata TaxID=152316 RepID=A0A9P8UEN7_9PEZI|nr:amino acid/polyamine transporter I [Truncatella angustata]KAH6648505.1 amino acid/polyamine transporter I [Truncatella angustata]
MDDILKRELETVDISEQQSTSENESSISNLEKQTRTRRLFSPVQLFFFNFVYMQLWYSTGGNMYFALANGGPAAWFFGYFIISFGALCQAASFAELASIQPLAGAQYYWTHHFAPESSKLFLTWLQGWTTWIAYIALLASCMNGTTVIFEGLIQINHPDYSPGGWHTTCIMIAMLAFCAFVNMYCFRLVPWFELFTGILNVCLFFVILVSVWVMTPKRNSADVFLITNVSTGWEGNYFVSANIGALSNIFLYLSFESIIHMGEESRNPKQAVPRAVLWSLLLNACLGVVMMVTFGLCMPALDILLSSSSPLVTILLYSTGPTMATVTLSILMVIGISGNVGVVSSVSRLTWAWARDGGLPHYFGYVDAKQRVPLRAVLLASTIVTILSLLNVGSGTYIAFGAIVSLSSLSAYLSYAIVIFCVLYARYTNSFKVDVWNLGRVGPLINVVALVYTLWVMIWLPFPNNLPVTASNMNYCGPVFSAVFAGIIGSWFIRARGNWQGPNRAVVDFVTRNQS